MQSSLDTFFPTLVRYTGWALMVVLVVGSIGGRIDFPAGYVAATGMILYKRVKDATNGGDN